MTAPAMTMPYAAPARGLPRPAPRHPMPGSRAARADARWPAIAAALTALRLRHRHAVRIVDADCACGALLIEAVRHARTLGFTAIEGRGIDGSPAMIGRARAAAARLADPAIGLTFELADMRAALTAEAEFPADLVLWHGDLTSDLAARLAAAGEQVIIAREQRA
jgi:hypothetical protein